MRSLLTLAVSLAVLTSGVDARAKRASEQYIALVRLEKSVPAKWERALQTTARNAVLSRAEYEWLPPPKVSIEETRMLLGCDEWDAVCVAQIGETLGAARVLYIEVVRPLGQPALLTVLSVGVKTPAVAQPLQVPLPDLEEWGLKVANVVVRAAVAGEVPTLALIKTDVEGVTIYLDEKKRGRTPTLLSSGIEPGYHDLRLEKKGYATVERRVKVEQGKVLEVQIPMPAEEVELPPPVTEQSGGTSTDPAPDVGADPDPEPDPGLEEPPLLYPHWDSPIAWIGIGIGAASMIAGGVIYAALYLPEATELKDLTEQTNEDGVITGTTQKDYEQRREAVNTMFFAYVGTAAAGALLAATGATFLFLPPPE